eukprot:XP_025011950.1 uncharacterized protein LOC8288449 [Ricinus communis]
MAEYDFPYTDSSVYNASGPDDWSSTSYILDHVCRPVIIDAEGRKRPIVSYGPQQNSDIYVTRTETIVKEHFLSPFASEHKHTPYTSPEGYGYAEERWQKPSGPVNSRLEKTDESHTRVQTEASKPRFDPFSQANWRKTTTSPGFSGNTGGQSSEFNDLSNHDWQKSGGNAYQNDNFDDYFSKHSSAMEPSMVTHGGWGRPNHNTWASPPDYILSKPTNDINTAVGIMKEAAKPSLSSGPNSRFTEPGFTETIDSIEAAWRYNFNIPSRPATKEDNCKTTRKTRNGELNPPFHLLFGLKNAGL